MQIYKTFFKVMSKYKISLSLYTAIIIFMLIAMTGMNGSSDETVADNKYTILIVDQDHSEVSESFVKFMGTRQNLKEGTYSDEQIKDMLYYLTIREYIVIPEGFGDKYMDIVNGGKEVTDGEEKELATSLLEATYDESMPYGIFINLQINQYLNAVKQYMNEGDSLEEASRKCTEALDVSRFVTMQKKESNNTTKVYTAFQFLPYGILTIIFSGVLPVVLSFNEKEKKNRTLISSYRMTKRNVAIAFGAATVAFGVTFILVTLASITSAGEVLFSDSWWLTVMNAFIYTLCISMLLSMIASLPLGVNAKGATNTTSFVTCVIGLAFSFLGGTFVDITMLGDQVTKVGRFTPNYWYSLACRKIWYEGASLSDVAGSFGFQLLFGAVCISIGLAFTRLRGNRSEN